MAQNDDTDRAARTLHKAQQDGVTASLGADGRILLNGTTEARAKWGEAIGCLGYEELVGAVLGSFIANAARTRHLDGRSEQLVAVIARATAAGLEVAEREVKSVEESDE